MFYENPNQPQRLSQRLSQRLWPVSPFRLKLWQSGWGLLAVIFLWGGMPHLLLWAKEPLEMGSKDKTETALVQTLPIGATVRVGTKTIELEVAKTPKQQEIGLMNRRSLAANRGMIFLFSPPRVALFWMKNTLIPLDMIFLSNNKIVAIYSNVPPCTQNPCPTYGPLVEIDRVIELQGGIAKTLGLEKGDSLEVKFQETSP